MHKAFPFLFLIFTSSAYGVATYSQSKTAARTIGTWLSKSTGHYDILSATPVGPKRAGDRFFIRGSPSTQTASDYGMSYSQIGRDSEVTEAYSTIGYDTSKLRQNLSINRLNLSFSYANKHDLSLSYLTSTEGLKGWGVGYKHVLVQLGYFYLSHRIQYGKSSLDDYFDNEVINNDLSASLYFRLIDFYVGLKHSYGSIDFKSPNPALKLPRIYYSTQINELDYFYGVALATTTNSRLNFQVNQIGREYAVSAKFSLHFDSLLPTANNWFEDPRYIKQ